MEYDKEFEDIVDTVKSDLSMTTKDRCWYIWQAARKDHYRIGEEVEIYDARAGEKGSWKIGLIRAFASGIASINNSDVRRITEKSRIDEIAEEAASHWEGGREALEKAIKSAILQARKEWEVER